MMRLLFSAALFGTTMATASVSLKDSALRLPVDSELAFNFTQNVLPNTTYTRLQADPDGDGTPNKTGHTCYLLHDSSEKDREVKKGISAKVKSVRPAIANAAVATPVDLTAVTAKGTALKIRCADGNDYAPTIAMLADFFTLKLPAPEEITRVQK